jgi:AraC-like DNA-binding protein
VIVTSEAVNFSAVRISTSSLPERDRIPIWREEIGRKLLRIDIEPQQGNAFLADATLRALPGLRFSTFASSGACFRRSGEILADGNDDFGLVLHLDGQQGASQRGQDAELEPGDAIASGDPAALTHSRAHWIGIAVPWDSIRALVPHVEETVMRRIPGDQEALRLLRSYLAIMREDLSPHSTELGRVATAHVHDLIALTIGATGEERALAAGRGLRAARLNAIKIDIVDHLRSSDLNVGSIAARHGIKPRYLHMLFEPEGVTFSAFVLENRLARAYRMLVDPLHRTWSVSTIALDSGFGDVSYFNRAFRRRYGATPTEIRRSQ